MPRIDLRLRRPSPAFLFRPDFRAFQRRGLPRFHPLSSLIPDFRVPIGCQFSRPASALLRLRATRARGIARCCLHFCAPLQHASTFMTEGLKRVEQEAQEFRDKVEQCRDKANSSMADTKGRLQPAASPATVIQYEAHKVPSLDPGEKEALRKVFSSRRDR